MSVFHEYQISTLQSVAKARSIQLYKDRLLPYATALYAELLSIAQLKRDDIFRELLEQVRKMDTARVSLWEFSKVDWKHNYADYTESLRTADGRRKNDERRELIRRNDWMTTIHNTDHGDLPVSIANIIRHTPVLDWLSNALGPNFEVVTHLNPGVPVHEDDTFSVYHVDIVVQYYPKGRPSRVARRIQSVVQQPTDVNLNAVVLNGYCRIAVPSYPEEDDEDECPTCYCGYNHT